MRHPAGSLFVVLVDACGSTVGRYTAFCLAIWSPYLICGCFRDSALSAMPLIVITSLATGLGLIIYPALLIGCFAYVRRESSPWWLLMPAVVSALDFWRVVAFCF